MGKFSRFVPGDPLKFRADTLNSFVDAAEWYSQSRVGGQGGHG